MSSIVFCWNRKNVFPDEGSYLCKRARDEQNEEEEKKRPRTAKPIWSWQRRRIVENQTYFPMISRLENICLKTWTTSAEEHRRDLARNLVEVYRRNHILTQKYLKNRDLHVNENGVTVKSDHHYGTLWFAPNGCLAMYPVKDVLDNANQTHYIVNPLRLVVHTDDRCALKVLDAMNTIQADCFIECNHPFLNEKSRMLVVNVYYGYLSLTHIFHVASCVQKLDHVIKVEWPQFQITKLEAEQPEFKTDVYANGRILVTDFFSFVKK